MLGPMITTQLCEDNHHLGRPPFSSSLHGRELTSRTVQSGSVRCLCAVNSKERSKSSASVRTLRIVHSAIGVCELACMGYLWFCVVTRRRDRWLKVVSSVLIGEGVALVVASGCPLGIVQRRAGDDVPMFELWFGPRIAPMAIPTFSVGTFTALMLLRARPPIDQTDARKF